MKEKQWPHKWHEAMRKKFPPLAYTVNVDPKRERNPKRERKGKKKKERKKERKKKKTVRGKKSS